MNENSNPEEIEKEIENTKQKASEEDFEIEIAEEPKQEETQETQEAQEKPKENQSRAGQ